MKNNYLFLILTLLVAVIVVGCNNQANTENDSSNDNDSNVTSSEIENFPTKPIELVIPYPPGGGTDIIFRLIASEVEKDLGQTIVPVNMEGANSTTGSRFVKDADPDGYTILGSHEIIATANITEIVDYSFEAFEPIALLTQTPSVIGASVNSGIKNIDDFKNYIESNPGELRMSMTPLSTDHFVAGIFMDSLGLSFSEVSTISYEGSGPQLTAITANEVDVGMFDTPSLKGLLENGSSVAIGVTSDERVEALPDVPTMKEQGADMTWSISRGLFAPKGTPEEIIVKIEEAFKNALENPELIEEIVESHGTFVNFLPHDEYASYVNETQEELERIADTMDIKPD